MPQLAPCASQRAPGGPVQLVTPRVGSGHWGAQPPPRVLERAASKVADFAAFYHVGGAPSARRASSSADTYIHAHVSGPSYCTYGLRLPASRVPYPPNALGSLPLRVTTVRTPYAYQPRPCRAYCVPWPGTPGGLLFGVITSVLWARQARRMLRPARCCGASARRVTSAAPRSSSPRRRARGSRGSR